MIYKKAHFGQGSGKIWIDKAHCQGNEEDIASCIGTYHQYYAIYSAVVYSYGGGWWSRTSYAYKSRSRSAIRYLTEWGHYGCTHSEDVSISCSKYTLIYSEACLKGH